MADTYQYEQKDRGTWLFHKEKAPNGRMFSSSQAIEMDGTDGWVDSPSKFTRVERDTSKANHAAVENAVAAEKESFLAHVSKQVAESNFIEYNDIFMQLNGKELSTIAMNFGQKKGLDLRKNIDTLRSEVKEMIKAHNGGLGE